jgi:hypothetical protein
MDNFRERFETWEQRTEQPTAPAPVELTISGKFMQDYAVGAPIIETQACEATYVARDGTLNIYSPVFFHMLDMRPAIDRIYASPGSQTGWARQRIVLPPEPPGGGTYILPTLVIIPGVRGTDTLLLFRHSTCQDLALGADGSIGPNIGTFAKSPSVPMLRGALAEETAFIPEILVEGSGLAQGVVLRDTLRWGLTYPVDPAAIPLTRGWNFGARRAIYPLKQQAPNGFAFIALEETGDVTFVRLEKAATGNRFDLKTRSVIAKSSTSCIHVRETSPGELEILLLEPPNVVSITGYYGPTVDFAIRSQPSGPQPSQPIPEFAAQAPGTILSMTAVTNAAAGGPALYIVAQKPGETAAADLWVTTRRGGAQAGAWTPIMLLDRGSRFISFFPGEAATFAMFRTATGFDVWRHSETGDFDQERIVEESDGTPVDSQVFRVGVELGANAAAGAPIAVRTTSTCIAIIDGRRQVLGPTRVANVLANEQGMVWISLVIENRLYVPSIIVSSPALGLDLRLDPDEKFREFLGKLPAAELAKAKDPRTGNAVLPKTENAEAVAKAIRELCALPPAEAPIIAAAARRPKPKSNVAASLVERGPRPPRPLAVRASGNAPFRLVNTNGVLRFETLSRTEVNQHLTRMAALRVAPMFGFGWLEDGFNWVKGGIEKIAEIIIDGVKVAVNVVIDGISYAYNFVIETVSEVFDAINWVLDQAGAALGTALGWLLEQLGFLFDWSAIKRRRDHLREVILRRAQTASTFIGDPKITLKAFSDQLQSARGTLADTLRQFGPSRSNRSTFGSILTATPALAVLASPAFNSDAVSALPEVMWLVDKAMSVLPGIGYSPGLPPIPNLETLGGDLLASVAAVGAKLAGVRNDIASLVTTWISDERLFTSASFEPILAVLIRRVIDILDALTGVVDAVGATLSALWSNMDKIIDWFDQDLPKTFFGGFYRGLTGHSLTVFDLACLIAAIPSEVGVAPAASSAPVGDAPVTAMTAGSGLKEDLREEMSRLMIARCITTGLNALYTAGTPKNADRITSWIGYAVTALDTLLGQARALVADKSNDNDARFWITAAGTFVAMVEAGGRRFGGQPNDLIVTNFQMTMGLVMAVRAVVGAPDQNYNILASDILSSVQTLLNYWVRSVNRPLRPPQMIPVYGVVQGGIQGARTWLEVKQPI